jgi:hypothetical protein
MVEDITQKLVKRLKEQGTDTDKVVYSICIGDIAECVAEVLEDASLSLNDLSDKKLSALIEKGIRASEWIDWSRPIQRAIADAVN